MLITTVVITKKADKDLAKVPAYIASKLEAWIESVEIDGLENVRKILGFRDEALKGRRKGQRSIRLSRAYRAIYEIKRNGRIEFISIEEVNKHEY